MRCPSCQAECTDQAEACFTCGKALFALTQGSLLAARYEVVRPIGKGGMSRVYEAFDRVLGEAVAIKVLRAELAWEPEMRQRFMHEIRLARRVSHPSVCRIHEYGEDGPLRYISMELVDGVNLKDVLRNRGLSTEEAFELALQMVDGLHAVHQHGIIHRDFKASNIMITRGGVAKLMDFGIAKQAELDTSGFTTPGQVMGTPEYMSPEHARGAKVDFRSDIYALGCVLFEIFTGQAPFRGPNAFATISKHFYEPAPLDGPLAALIPEALVPVLRKALAKDPSRRYANVPEAREALRQAQLASVPDAAAGPPENGAMGSARLRRLCEALLAHSVGGGGSSEGRDVSATDDTPSVYLRSTPARASEETPAPAAAIAAPPPAATRPRAPRRPMLVGAALGGGLLIAAASSMLLWSAGRDLEGRHAPPSPAPVPVQRSAVSSTGETANVSTGPAPLASARPAPPAATPLPSATHERARARAGSEPAPAQPAPSPQVASANVAPARGPERTRAAAEPQNGTLRLLVVPWAEVMVDGTSLGTVKLRDIPLAPGVHAVHFVHPDYKPLQRKVTIQPGGEVQLVMDLSEKGVRKSP